MKTFIERDEEQIAAAARRRPRLPRGNASRQRQIFAASRVGPNALRCIAIFLVAAYATSRRS